MKSIAVSFFCALLSILARITGAIAEERPITIGVVTGVSGAAARWNKFQNMGITLAQEESVAAGFPVRIIFEDSRTESPRALTAFHKLINLNKVDAVLADDFGFVIAPLLPVAEKKRVFLTAVWLPHSRYCEQAPRYFYSAASQVSLTKPVFERFFDRNPDVKTVALIHFDDPEWGNMYRDIWEEAARSRGITIVDTFTNNEWLPDFKSVLTRMIPKKPDAIFVAHEPESFLKAARQLHYKGKIVATNNVLEMLADSSTPRAELDGVYTLDVAVSEDFQKRFIARFRRAPILEAYAGYEALRSMIAAFRISRAEPASAMKQVAYEGVAGPIDFRGGSCAGNQARWGLFQFKEGKQVLIPE